MRKKASHQILVLLAFLASLTATRAATTELRFDSRGVSLAGTLLMPTGEGPHPGLVFLHGSGPHDRNHSRSWAKPFVELGFAALIFDKRGCGASRGHWTRASLDDLAADAAAAFHTLAARPEVDPHRIGFFGPSQAAWIAPMASARVDPALLILISGGGVSPRVAERFAYSQALDEAGVDAAGKERAGALLDHYFTFLETGRGRDQIAQTLEAAKGSRWAAALGLEHILVSEANRHNWQWVATFDPMPWIEKLRMPILLIFGTEDRQQPTVQAVERWRLGLTRAGNSRASIQVFPGADHRLRPAGAAHSHSSKPMPLVDGVWSAIETWIKPWLTVGDSGSP